MRDPAGDWKELGALRELLIAAHPLVLRLRPRGSHQQWGLAAGFGLAVGVPCWICVGVLGPALGSLEKGPGRHYPGDLRGDMRAGGARRAALCGSLYGGQPRAAAG